MSADGLLTANDLVIYLNAADADPLNRSSISGQKYRMMVVLQPATVTFTTTWHRGDGTKVVTFTSKVLQPGNYPRYIYDVTVESGEVWLLL